MPQIEERNDKKLHVSSIIKKILVESDPKRFGREWADQEKWNLVLGLGWEHVALHELKKQDPSIRFATQLQLSVYDKTVRRRVWGTPDAIDNYERIHEFKFTRFAVRRPAFDTEFGKYYWQLMAYCKMHNTRRGCLMLCHWGYDGPAVRIVEVEFTRDQIAANWAMLMHHAKEL